MGIFSFFKKRTSEKAIFCGLDNSGKSTIISFLMEGRFVDHSPTLGKDLKKIEVDGTKFHLFDLGGQKHFRQLWTGELLDAKCVVYVIDSSDSIRFRESKQELHKLIPLIREHEKKLLILSNKTDKENSVNVAKLIDNFEIDRYPNFEVMDISAKTGYNMANAFAKLYSLITGKITKKNIVTNAISVYDKHGLPIVTHSLNDQEYEEDILTGGFLTAISHFAKVKNDASCIKMESKSKGTFIIKQCERFIGALLWNKELDVSIVDSEKALDDLLNHLDKSVKTTNLEEIAINVIQYSTNMM